jgi:hypothetical protein
MATARLFHALALTASLAACTSSPSDGPAPSSGGGGGKGDDPTASSCPVDADPSTIIDAIAGGGSCYVAAGIAEACAFGSTIDTQFVAAATQVCSRGFSAMTGAARADHDALLARCGAKYENEEGTLYRAAEAFCTLEVTRLFDIYFPEPERSDPVVPFSETCLVPGGDSDVEKALAAIEASHYCGHAADIATTCAWGSSIDTQLAGAAAATCQAPETTSDVALRDRLLALCSTTLADEEGTLGVSIRAHCALQVAVVLDSVLSPVD